MDPTALEVGRLAQRDTEIIKTVKWVGSIVASALPLWMIQGIVSGVAGTTTTVSLNLTVTGISIGVSVALAVVVFRLTKTVRRQRTRTHDLESTVEEKDERIFELEVKLDPEDSD